MVVSVLATLRARWARPVSVVPGIGGALWPVTFIVIQVVTNLYDHRAGLYRLLGAPISGWRPGGGVPRSGE